MRNGWRMVVLGLGPALVATLLTVEEQGLAQSPAADAQVATAAVESLEVAPAAVPRRVRGFNTAQLLDWLDEAGVPLPGTVSCPAPTRAQPGRRVRKTRFDCAIDLMKASGSKMHRLLVYWADVQPSGPSEWKWAKYDTLVERATAAGITRVILTPVGSPNWARDPERVTEPMGPFSRFAHPDVAYLNDWANFVREVATRFAAVGYEIGNEQNTNNFWDATPTNQAPSESLYKTLYCAAGDAIRAARPSALVGVGGLAPILRTNRNPGDTSDKRVRASAFVRNAFNEGIGQGTCVVNFVGFHPYLVNAYCTRNPPIGSTNVMGELARVHDVMTAHGIGARKVWITEWGFPSRNFRNCTRYSAAEQARLIRLEHNYLARLSYTAFSGYFNLVDDDQPNVNGSIGMVCSNWSPKPSYNTWRHLLPAAPGTDPRTQQCGGEEL